MKTIRFLWWNLQDFAHYDKARRQTLRWPSSAQAFEAKLERVALALEADSQRNGRADVITLGEVTRRAAHALRDRAFPGYEVHALDLDTPPYPASHEVAWLAAPELDVVRQLDIQVLGVPRTTRRMGVLDLRSGDICVRFIACHWTALENGRDNRQRIADHLNHEVYRFLEGTPSGTERRSVVILGDLNEEPFGVPQSHLHALRSRAQTLAPLVYQDRDVERVRLYNCAWRLLGERRPHGVEIAPEAIDAAGTCWDSNDRRWATFDQVIVSGGLLGSVAPRIDETSVAVVALRAFAPDLGVPQKFAARGDTFTGVSDHLPVCGRIVLGD